jgi:hypothetical protein
MKLKRGIAGAALAGLLLSLAPAAPVIADGAASTRNIILGVGAATYLIIQHNRKVHQRYAEDARRQAQLSQQANDASAAYNSEKSAYDQQLAVNADLQREIAYQHSVIVQQQHQLASLNVHNNFMTQRVVGAAPKGKHARKRATQVAVVSYGWGSV